MIYKNDLAHKGLNNPAKYMAVCQKRHSLFLVSMDVHSN